MPENRDVFHAISEATTRALRMKFGPQKNAGNEQLPAQIAVALMQLSLRYFAETKAPKQVVLDFFLQLMGVEGEKPKLEERDGKLVIVPPKKPLVLV